MLARLAMVGSWKLVNKLAVHRFSASSRCSASTASHQLLAAGAIQAQRLLQKRVATHTRRDGKHTTPNPRTLMESRATSQQAPPPNGCTCTRGTHATITHKRGAVRRHAAVLHGFAERSPVMAKTRGRRLLPCPVCSRHALMVPAASVRWAMTAVGKTPRQLRFTPEG